MKNTIYMVKKDPTKPNSQDNWILMNLKEFNSFIQTPEAKGRYFADIGGHEESDTWYVVECPKETAMKWRKELNRHYYLKRMERECGYQTAPYHNLEIGDEDVNGEELISDMEDDFAAEILHKIDIENLEKALNALKDEEYEIIYDLYLRDDPLTLSYLAASADVEPSTVMRRRNNILEKIKIFLTF